MKILAVGDRQIGVGAQYPDRLAEQEAVGHQIVDLALEHQVDLIVDGGDVFEGSEVNDEHREAYIRPLERLQGRVPILVCLGNGRHDRAVKPANALQTLRHVPGLTVACKPDVYDLAGATVAVLPWVHPGRFIAAHGRGGTDDLNTRIAELLVDVAAELREKCELGPEKPAVLLLHWAISGASLPTGLPSDLMGEPVIPRSALQALGFHAVIASHIHVPQLLWNDGTVGLYTGSPMPHDFGEAGYEHGCWIVELGGEPMTVRAEFIPIPSRPFVTIDEHLDDHDQLGLEVACTGEEVTDAIVRVRLTGTAADLRGFDLAKLRHAVYAAGAAVVRVQPEIVRAERARVQGLDEQVGELDALEQWIRAEGVEGMGELLRARTRGYLEATF